MRSLLSTILFLVFIDGYAQSGHRKSYLEITAGPSFPVGAYAEKDITNSASGFARTGQVLKFTYTRLVKKHFGFAATVHGQRNALNTKALEGSFSQAQMLQPTVVISPSLNPAPAIVTYGNYPDWKFEKESWWLGSLLLGGYGQFALEQAGKLMLTAKTMMGAVYAYAPEIKGISASEKAMARITQSSGSAFGFAYSVAGGAKYKLTDKLSLNTQVEYFGTNKIRFQDIKGTFTTSHLVNGTPAWWSTSSVTEDGKLTIGSMNVLVGIGLSW